MKSSENKKESQTNEKYLDLYLGKTKEKVINDKYSFPCILGPIYALYNNMCELGFIWIIIEGLIIFFTPLPISIILAITINITIGFKYNELVYKKALKEIEKIEKDKTIKEKEKVCKKRGKPSIFMLTSSVVIYVLFIFLFLITHGKINKTYELWMIIPKDFVKETSYGPYQGYKLHSQNDQCYIDLTAFESKKQTPNNYLNSQTHEEDSEISGLEIEKINNKNWYKVEEKTKEGYKKYYYAAKEKDRIYSVKYNIYHDSGICLKSKESFIKSLRF